MPRNYNKESAWQKEKYRRFQAKLHLDEATQLQKHLAENELGFTEWVRLKLKEDTNNGR